jgi:uncharacterized protein (UPF0335 family)
MTNNSQLKSVVDRVVNLEEQRAGLSEDIKEILTEAASNGFDKAAIRATVKIQMESAEKRAKRLTREELIEVYTNALGQLSETPLGRAAIERAVA